MRIVPLRQRDAVAFVTTHHRHHPRPEAGSYFQLGLEAGGELVAVAVVGRPKAAGLDQQFCFEITRVANASLTEVNACSRLYSACARAALAMGYRRGITYTRADEPGTSLRAANWHPTATVTGREWTTGNKNGRWLPGLYEPTTEVIDRIRWEYGPEAEPEAEALKNIGRRTRGPLGLRARMSQTNTAEPSRT